MTGIFKVLFSLSSPEVLLVCAAGWIACLPFGGGLGRWLVWVPWSDNGDESHLGKVIWSASDIHMYMSVYK